MEINSAYLEKSEILFYVRLDLHGNYSYLSPHFCDYFGYKSEDYLGKHSFSTICEEDHQICLDLLSKCKKNPDKAFTVKLRKPGKNGKIIFTQWEFTLEIDENKQPLEFICVGFDITKKVNRRNEIVELNQEIEDKEHKYKTLFETSSLGILLHNPNGDLYDANQAFCNMVGIEKQDIKKYNIYHFSPEEYWQKDKDFINDLILKRTVSNYEKEFIKNNSEKTPVSINGKAFFDKEEGTLIWCIAKDITERKYHEEQLKQQNELLKQTAGIAKLGGWELDLKTLKTTWTKEVYEIHDREIETINTFEIDKSLANYRSEDRQMIREALKLTIKNGQPYNFELRFTSFKNKEKWVRVSGEATIKDGEIVGIKGIIQDISERKNTEETILTQNELLKEIYYSQSHLMRLPLANILGLVDLLELETDPEELKVIKRKLKLSATHLDQIIKELANKKVITNLP
ncbi:MAG: PAS domain S-box protein [Oligoflexus sp.]|nr:PAS domain S-box protein [Pseudopedobacter sp.]